MSGDPEAGGGDVATDLPKVVLLVRRAEAPAEPAVPKTVEPEPEVAEVPSAADAAADAAYALATADTKTYDRPEFHQEDMPTVKLRKEPARTWTAEDDVLVAAVLPLDVRAEPGPLSSFLGRSLLYRAAHAAAAADAPRLIVLGHFGDQRAQLEAEARAGFGGPVELREGDVDELGERGRVLVLDGGALHDPTSVRRLGRVRGAKTSLLLGSYGDGLCVRTNEGRITEMGRGMDEPDGVVAGACSAPLEHYEVLAGVGERAALEALGSEDELVATVAPRTYGQQLHDQRSLRVAEANFFDRLASRGSEGPIDLLVGSQFSRPLTVHCLQGGISAATVSLAAGLLAVLGAAALGLLQPPLGAILGGLLLIGSAIFDRVDGELARLRLEDEGRLIDFGLDHLAHMLVFLALGFAVHQAGDMANLLAAHPPLHLKLGHLGANPIFVGFVACAGVMMLGLVLWHRGPPTDEPTSSILIKLGDFLATTFSSRDYFYLLLVMGVVNVLLPPGSGLMAIFLLATTVLFHALWVVILFVTLLSPPRD